MLNIGLAAKATALSSKMIRHYEDIGLLPAARRTAAGYRQYDESDVRTLRFIRHARDLGFPVPRIARLLSLWSDRHRTSREVKALIEEHVRELDEKARELLAMKAALDQLARSCSGNSRPECPIIESLGNRDAPVQPHCQSLQQEHAGS